MGALAKRFSLSLVGTPHVFTQARGCQRSRLEQPRANDWRVRRLTVASKRLKHRVVGRLQALHQAEAVVEVPAHRLGPTTRLPSAASKEASRSSNSPTSSSLAAAMPAAIKARSRAMELSRPRASVTAISISRRMSATVRLPGRRMEAQERAESQTVFLDAFSSIGISSLACAAASIHRSTLYDWLSRDPAFASGYALARAEADDVIRAEIYRRAVKGTQRTKTVE